MAAIQIGNVSEEVAFNDFTVNVDLLDLAEIYDAALLKFIYGQEPDLSDSTTLSQAMFNLGSTSQVIDGLSEGETYYYKVVADTVAYNSAASMGNVIDERGFMDDLTDNEVEMDKVTDSVTAMDKVTDSEIAMDKVTDSEIAMDKVVNNYWIDPSNLSTWLLSPHIIDTMWSKEMASEKFWKTGTPTIPFTDNEISVGTVPFQDGLGLSFDYNFNDQATTSVIYQIDLTNISQLKLKAESYDSTAARTLIRVRINGTTEISETYNGGSISGGTPLADYTIDTTTYEGICDIQFIGGRYSNTSGTPTGYTRYYQIQLIE